MAMAEAKSILFHLVGRYQLKPPSSTGPDDPVDGFSRPFYLMTMTIKPHEAWVDILPRSPLRD